MCGLSLGLDGHRLLTHHWPAASLAPTSGKLVSAFAHSVSSKCIAEAGVSVGMSCMQMYCSVVHAKCNMFVLVCVANGGIADSVPASAQKAFACSLPAHNEVNL